MVMPPFFRVGMFILFGATLVHLFFVAVLGTIAARGGVVAGRGLRIVPLPGLLK